VGKSDTVSKGLNMYFSSFEEFLMMGGHGLYVWLCYGVGFLVLMICFLSPIIKKRTILKELRQVQRREQVQTSSNLLSERQ
jgi:heme exporter protein D